MQDYISSDVLRCFIAFISNHFFLVKIMKAPSITNIENVAFNDGERIGSPGFSSAPGVPCEKAYSFPSCAVRNSLSPLITGSEALLYPCLLYTSPSPRDYARSRMPSSACKNKYSLVLG